MSRPAPNTRLGIWLMIAVALFFAIQDGISRHLAGEYNVFMVIMIRFCFLAAFVLALAARQPGGIRAAARSRRPLTQLARGVILAAEIMVAVSGFTLLGLTESHAVFAVYPLLVAALSGPILGENVGWRRWIAIGIGFLGVLVILNPGSGMFQMAALVPLAAALMFALYGLLTRHVSRDDPTAVSFFWAGIVGAVMSTAIGVWFWQPMRPGDWGWMGLLCLTSALSHWLLIKAYEVAEASAIQPFAYLQMPFASAIGIAFFGESLRPNVAIGAGIVVCAGLFTLWRARVRGQDRQGGSAG